MGLNVGSVRAQQTVFELALPSKIHCERFKFVQVAAHNGFHLPIVHDDDRAHGRLYFLKQSGFLGASSGSRHALILPPAKKRKSGSGPWLGCF